MVGIFSRFSVSRIGHRRSQSALDEREVLPPNSEITGASNAAAASSHGIEVAGEFKPVEHPNEPLDNDRPIQCPLPEPSILNHFIPPKSVSRREMAQCGPTYKRFQDGKWLNVVRHISGFGFDGRIWKERVSATVRRRADLPVMKEGASLEPEGSETKPKPPQTQPNRSILPSVSAPEHNILNLLEECNASGI